VRCPPGKRARRVPEIPLHPTLVVVLREHRRALVAVQHPGLASGYVFPAERTLLHPQASPVNRVIGEACRRAKVAPPARKLHALRRAFSDALRRVAPGDVTRSMTGHVTEAMTRHYSTITTDEKRFAVEAAFAFLPAQVGAAGGGETPVARIR
jgi:integrase